VGAVQKLATIVVVGLTALATLLVVYVANEGNRATAEAEEQEEVAIERGAATFLQQCVVCHGPAGNGALAGDGRIGFPLNPAAGPEGPDIDNSDDKLDYRDNQSEDPAVSHQRYNLIVKTLHNGRGLMPAFGRGADGGAILNDEQIHELATMIEHIDWDRIYNEAIAEAGGAYPTAPPPAAPAAAASGGQGSADALAQAQAATPQSYVVEMVDIAFNPAALTVAADTPITIQLPNAGASVHNFNIDPLDVHSGDIPGGDAGEVTITAPAGAYEYYCNIPGHREAGMVGELMADPNAAIPAEASPGPAAVDPAAGAPNAIAPVTVEMVDIAFNPAALSIPAAVDVIVDLPNGGSAVHNFNIDLLGVHSGDVPGGGAAELVINAGAGDYEYYCSVPGHREAGMVGTLTVASGPPAPATSGSTVAVATPAGTPAATPLATAGAAASPVAAQEAAVEMVDIAFDPTAFTIPAGTDIMIDLTNAGAAKHSFNIDQLNVHSATLPGGSSGQVLVNAPPGSYEYYCSIPGHREAGMVGTVTAQ